jgi:hypothetical protein
VYRRVYSESRFCLGVTLKAMQNWHQYACIFFFVKSREKDMLTCLSGPRIISSSLNVKNPLRSVGPAKVLASGCRCVRIQLANWDAFSNLRISQRVNGMFILASLAPLMHFLSLVQKWFVFYFTSCQGRYKGLKRCTAPRWTQTPQYRLRNCPPHRHLGIRQDPRHSRALENR